MCCDEVAKSQIMQLLADMLDITQYIDSIIWSLKVLKINFPLSLQVFLQVPCAIVFFFLLSQN